MLYFAVSALIIHTVGQLCDIFSLSFSLLSVWHLLNLSGVYWCNNWCLHSPTPPLLCGAPHAPTQWIHLHPDYRTNCHAGRKANQILRQQLGEEIAFPLSGRGASPSSLCLRFYRRERSKGWKGESYCSWTARLPQVKSQPFPPIFTLSFHFPPHSSWHYLSVTLQHQGLHSSLQSSRWNGTIIMGIEWLWPPNWGRSDHNNTLSNLIK